MTLVQVLTKIPCQNTVFAQEFSQTTVGSDPSKSIAGSFEEDSQPSHGNTYMNVCQIWIR